LCFCAAFTDGFVASADFVVSAGALFWASSSGWGAPCEIAEAVELAGSPAWTGDAGAGFAT
jgi:hypothetical protein